jgi:hypothetical protein
MALKMLNRWRWSARCERLGKLSNGRVFGCNAAVAAFRISSVSAAAGFLMKPNQHVGQGVVRF